MNGQAPIACILPELFSSIPGLVSIQTTRTGGVSRPPFDSLNLGTHTDDHGDDIRKNYRRLESHLGIGEGSIVLTRQVHGTAVCRIEGPGDVDGYDALMTDCRGIYLGIVTADCYPLLVLDRRRGACAAIHAGWQGTAGNIAGKAVRAMADAYGTRPGDCLAWVGAGISGKRYEVGEEVAGHFSGRYLSRSAHADGKYLLDLSAANREQLTGAGIPPGQVAHSPLCTFSDRELFFSYRRDTGRTGRMLSLIGLRPSSGTP